MKSTRWRYGVAGTVLLIAIGGGALGLKQMQREPAVTVPEFDTAQAFPQVEQALQNAISKVRQAPRSGRTWGHLGMLAMAHNFQSQAVTCFARTAELLPNQFQWPYYLAILEETSDMSAALQWYEQAERLAPRYAPLRMRRARLLMRLNRLDDAEQDLRVAAHEESDSPYPYIALGRLELARGNLGAAREHCEIAVRNGSWSRDAHLELARIWNRLGHASDAYREQQEAARLPAVAEDLPDPVLQDVEDLELTGRRTSRQADEAIRKGDLNTAVKFLQQVIRERPDLSRPRLNLGQVLQFQGKTAEAVEVFQEAVREFPQEALAQFSLGTALEMSGQRMAAAEAYRAALRLKPDYADASFGLGSLLREDHDYPGSVAALRQAVSANPGFAPAHVILGLCLDDLGSTDEGIAEIRLAVKLAPQDREAKRQLERLLKKTNTGPHDTNSSK
ncbi:MAG: tetratricopeptide repeat protein [Planctomycetes bacterium]|nr:tetratricopeptide repeat protein [Planctomycetota bacterium]